MLLRRGLLAVCLALSRSVPEAKRGCWGDEDILCWDAFKRRCLPTNPPRLYRLPGESFLINGRIQSEDIIRACFPCLHPLDAYKLCCNQTKYGPEGNSMCWGWIQDSHFFASFSACCVKEQPDPQTCTEPRQCWDPLAWQPSMPRLLRWGVSSQSTQDSVLIFLFSILGVTNAIFVEFGYISTDGSNTELLKKTVFRHTCGPDSMAARVMHFHVLPQWTGLLLDIVDRGPAVLREEVKMDTIVKIFRSRGVPLEPDYVSIDIDSCDMWVFLCMTATFRPRVVSVEYNRRFPLGVNVASDCLTAEPEMNDVDYLRGHGASLSAIATAARARNYHVVWVVETDVFLVRGEEFCEEAEVPSLDQATQPFKFWTGDTVLRRRHHPGRLVDIEKTLDMWGPIGLEAACNAPTDASKIMYNDPLLEILVPPADID